MHTLAAGLGYIDLKFLGRSHAIATVVVHGPGRVALVDPGPASCLPTLELGLEAAGLRLSDVTEILLTHIHLDHAGATGTIVRRHPEIEVVVHHRGAPHLIAPERLLESARRLWGTEMDRLWGEVAPVPAANLRVVNGDEQVSAAGRIFEVAYTPGHASHHVSFFDAASGIAFVGDTAGVCIDGGYILPPTPPPDIDLDVWRASAARIERWMPVTLFLTHFGPAPEPRPHLAQLLDHLDVVAGLVRTSLEGAGPDEDRATRFAAELRRELRRKMPETQIGIYETAAQFELLWLGLARYWRKRGLGN